MGKLIFWSALLFILVACGRVSDTNPNLDLVSPALTPVKPTYQGPVTWEIDPSMQQSSEKKL